MMTFLRGTLVMAERTIHYNNCVIDVIYPIRTIKKNTILLIFSRLVYCCDGVYVSVRAKKPAYTIYRRTHHSCDCSSIDELIVYAIDQAKDVIDKYRDAEKSTNSTLDSAIETAMRKL